MPTAHLVRRNISALWLAPTIAISLLVGAYLAITLVTANLAAWGQWLRDFAQSPGAAAFAALTAAVIAYSGISRQIKVSRESLAHQKDAAKTDAWWAMFEWVSDRAIPPRKEDEPLPTTVTISTLERLSEVATSGVQKAACAGVIDALTKNIGSRTTEPPLDPDTTSPEPDDTTLAALDSYVESNRGTPAASMLAESFIYEDKVIKSLASLTAADPTLNNLQLQPADAGADAVVDVDGRQVLIQIKTARNPQYVGGMVFETIRKFRTRGSSTDGYLVITPFPSPLRPDQEAELRAVAAQWQAPTDNASLQAALHRASALNS
ncbi:hypothetical protein ACIG47_13325 [Promicromonospora sp. NPDC052451]|uniref:hypothetical protein n=1 Tax=Promicromonospora sp. NPDC052451 TaxID=3364407 RepID=UPI0037C7326A